MAEAVAAVCCARVTLAIAGVEAYVDCEIHTDTAYYVTVTDYSQVPATPV